MGWMGWSWDLNGPLWLVLMGLCLIAIVVGVVLIIRSGHDERGSAASATIDQWHQPPPGGWTSNSSTASEAIRILDERYARGDITRDEYVQALEDISASARRTLS
jgi:uncharacterized membrane protein